MRLFSSLRSAFDHEDPKAQRDRKKLFNPEVTERIFFLFALYEICAKPFINITGRPATVQPDTFT
jgi:hypothetical protein